MSKTTPTTTCATLPLRPYTPLQLSEMYQVSKKTFNKWLKPFAAEIGRRNGHFYTINQVQVIIEKIGFPGILVAD
jgi:hypothetical protein